MRIRVACFLLLWMAACALLQPAVDAQGAPQPLPTDKTGLYAIQRLLGRTRGQVNVDIIRRLGPTLSPEKAAEIARALNAAMAEAGIRTNLAKAAFLAQLAHESGGFKYMRELASGEAYEGRRDLGNTQPGDGRRYKGRGFIQVTGRSNYTQASAALGLDLVGNPELAETVENAARISAWYWRTRNITEPADRGDFVAVTRKINGGTNGLADREQRYAQAKQALGI